MASRLVPFSPLPRQRHLAAAALLLLTCSALNAAAAFDTVLPDPQMVLQLEQRALTAKPPEQCFLYAELVHAATELAGREMHDGDFEKATASLKRVEHYAQLIHMGLADDTKRLKDAELLMHHTVFRLNGLVRAASVEDRETLRSTLRQLDQVQGELLTQVFKR